MAGIIVKMTFITTLLALSSSFSSVHAKATSKYRTAFTGKPGSKVAGGIVAPLGSVPHQVVLATKEYYSCSGSIIARDFVVTAGQCCLTEFRPTGVLAGVNDLESPEEGAQRVNVDQVLSHPNFTDGKNSVNDLCILHLKDPLVLGNATRTAIIGLPPAGYRAEGNANVSGWGFTLNGHLASRLMSTQVPIINDEECQQHNGPNGPAIVQSMLCAGDKGKGACVGDAGGPLVDSKKYLVGVVSWGDACANKGYIGVHTEVSYFVGWIHETMSQIRKGETNTRNNGSI